MAVPYCGFPPVPGMLLDRWNLDPFLIAALLSLASLHWYLADSRQRPGAVLGWLVAALALLSPLCALSVSLFSARVGQHMILSLVAAPLIAMALPPDRWRLPAWASLASFTIALWCWHLPQFYDLTFASDAAYWAMHLTIFGSALLLWRDLLRHDADKGLAAAMLGVAASTQMGFLGAFLTLAGRPLFSWHVFTTEAWGFTPLEDQQMGGLIMWVPGCMIFLWPALRTLVGLLRVHGHDAPHVAPAPAPSAAA